MIFVTVGTTDFDALVVAADQLAATTDESVVIQIGHGEVEPRHARWLRFAPSLDPFYEQAGVVVTHGGLGTVTEVLRRGLRTVGVSNPDRFDRHQDQILQAFEQAGHLVWCRDLAELPAAIERARGAQFVPYQPPPSHIHRVVDRFLRDLGGK
jgi:UDP-N-acetylglucosamine transferase subunit ALG13